MKNSIQQLLADLELINENNLELFSTKTRDKSGVNVVRDDTSGVIFIQNSLTEDSVYQTGEYRPIGVANFGKRDYEISVDVRRRLKDYEQFYVGKTIIDFGCGEGTFLREAQKVCEDVIGIEIEQSFVKNLNDNGISCFESLADLSGKEVQSIFCFHTLEHLQQPIETLKYFKNILPPQGNLVIEVPHANDFLLKYLKNDDFKNFTLWSQHLILHSRVSLGKFLKKAGFNNFFIQGKQRYKLSNHLNWLALGKAGGHKTILSSIDTDELSNAYERSLQMIDATDTLVAIVVAE